MSGESCLTTGKPAENWSVLFPGVTAALVRIYVRFLKVPPPPQRRSPCPRPTPYIDPPTLRRIVPPEAPPRHPRGGACRPFTPRSPRLPILALPAQNLRDMPLAPRYRALLTGTAGAVPVAGVIAFTTIIPYALAAGVLLFAWPVTGFLIDLIQRRNPHYDKRVPADRDWRILAGWLAACVSSAARSPTPSTGAFGCSTAGGF